MIKKVKTWFKTIWTKPEPKPRYFLVQCAQYGFTRIEAEDWEDAEDLIGDMSPKDFDMTNDMDIDILDEVDEEGRGI